MKPIVYLLLGASVGAVLALLFAPQSGKELRASIQSVAGQESSKVQSEWQTASAKTKERKDQVQADLKQSLHRTPDEEGEAA